MLEVFLGLLVLATAVCGLVVQTTATFKVDSLQCLTPAMEPLHGAKVGLLGAPFTPTENTTYADVTAPGVLPTYTGYAEQSVAAWTAAFRDDDGVIKIDGGDLLFIPGSYGTPNSIYGWYLADSTDTNVFQVVMFDAPVNLVAAPDAVLVDVQVAYGA